MNKKIEKEILATTNFISKYYKLNELDTIRLKNILIKIAHSHYGEKLYSPENIDNIDVDFEYVSWLDPHIGPYLDKIPKNKVFELFENNEINDLLALEYFLSDLDFEFFFTYEELNNILKAFIIYLKNNRTSIINTGFPLKSFELSYWFYNNLSNLYPLKQPFVILRKEKDKEGNFLLEYHWLKTHEISLNSCNLKKEDFLSAPYYTAIYSFSAIDLIENKRPILFEIKVDILSILSDALFSKNCVGLWEKCIKSIADKLELQDFKYLLQMREIDYLFSGIYDEKDHKNLYRKYNILNYDNFFREGGITQIIELLFQVEKELRLGPINKTKNKLISLSKNKTISTYYDLLINIDFSELFGIGFDFHEYQKEEEKYRDFFKKRLSNNLKQSFKPSLSDKSDSSESIEATINSIINKINSKTDFTGSKNVYKTNINNIIHIKFPPGTKWEQIVIQFIDNEKIKITAPKNFKYVADYREMDFEDKKKIMPDTQWEFLHLLSYHGNLSWENLAEMTHVKNIKDLGKLVEQAKKKKQKIKERFMQFFQINEDPFYPYSKSDGYHPKFSILPQEHLQ